MRHILSVASLFNCHQEDMRKDMQDPYVTVDAIPGIDILLVSDPKKT